MFYYFSTKVYQVCVHPVGHRIIIQMNGILSTQLTKSNFGGNGHDDFCHGYHSFERIMFFF